MPLVPVLEIGGTHVAAALVDNAGWTIASAPTRLGLQPDCTAEEFLATLTRAAATLQTPPSSPWGVAMPDPFDYARGIALFHDVGKFEALHGLAVGAALRQRLGAPVLFLNDADAFTLGEWATGAGIGTHRCVGLTLGTGVGSGWLVDGQVVSAGPGVPPGGRAHRLIVDGRPLEEAMSRRAIRASYARTTSAGTQHPDVREIADRARAGETRATAVLAAALQVLGRAIGPALRQFEADVLVVGGSMAGSWDLFEPWFREGAGAALPPIRLAEHPDAAPLFGAAQYVLGR